MNSGAAKSSESPSEIIIKVKEDKMKDEEMEKIMTAH